MGSAFSKRRNKEPSQNQARDSLPKTPDAPAGAGQSGQAPQTGQNGGDAPMSDTPPSAIQTALQRDDGSFVSPLVTITPASTSLASVVASDPLGAEDKGAEDKGAEDKSAEDKSAEDKPALGINFEILHDLAQSFPDASTEEVCRRFIFPETLSEQCAYIELLKDKFVTNGQPAVAPATCFVSHAWKCKFGDVVDCLKQHEEKHGNSYYWFDLLTNNQHKATSFPFEWWCSTFRESIRKIGSVLLIMTPWDEPVPLTRAWCLFEILSTILVEANMHIAIPSSQHQAFKKAIRDDFNSILKVLMQLDGRRAAASQAEDLRRIFQVVEQMDGGFDALNNTVKKHLREWYLLMVSRLAQDTREASLLYNTGMVLAQFGDLDGSFELMQQCLLACRQPQCEQQGGAVQDGAEEGGAKDGREVGAADQAIVPNAIRAIGNTYMHKGEYATALEHYNEAMVLFLSSNATDSPDVARTHLSLGQIYKHQDQFAQAMLHFDKALTILLATVGNTDPDTARTYNAMGQVYRHQDDHQQALQCFEKSLAITLLTVGDRHPDTAISHGTLGQTYNRLGDYDRALDHHQKSLAIFLATLGDVHSNVARTHFSIAQAFVSKHEDDAAIQHFEKALAVFEATLGDTHELSAHTNLALGEAYLRKGDTVLSLHHYKKAETGYAAAFGDDDSRAQKARRAWARIQYRDQFQL